VFTRLAERSREAGHFVCRILSLGLRAQESPARAKKKSVDRDGRSSNGQSRSGSEFGPAACAIILPTTWASRASAAASAFSDRAALLPAGKHNPALLAEYVATEKKIGWTYALGAAQQPLGVPNGCADTPHLTDRR
jgi:hypothetical protein